MEYTLEVSQLYHACESELFSFDSTEELEPLTQPIGQKKAFEAVDFAIDIQQSGYNVFAMGPAGSGKFSTILSFLQEKAASRKVPSDWCYVNNFQDPRKPLAIELSPGKAAEFKEDVDELVELLKEILPTVFESNSYHNEREAIVEKYLNQQSAIFKELQEEALKHDVAMDASSMTRVTFVPIIDGKKLSAEEFKAIKGEQKEEINRKLTEYEAILKEGLRKVSELAKAQQKEFKSLDKKTTENAVTSLIDDLREKYGGFEKIIAYLDALKQDVIRNVRDFVVKLDDMNMPPFMQEFYAPTFSKYEVNLLISHEADSSAPVIFEDNPTHQNIIGKMEYSSQVGTLITDFTMIKPGALHKANGGYLILNARKLLMQPFAYEELKRVLRSKEIRIESLVQQYSLISTTSLEPEPIPIDVKVVLIGERVLYYLLHHYDPDFEELFKVSADFEDDMPRSKENIGLYARMIGTIAKRDGLLPLTPNAVARVIEESSREVSHALKFSTHLRTLSDLLKEADYWSKKEGSGVIDKQSIDKVLLTRKERLNRIQRKLYEMIEEGTIMINVGGSTVGQINALSFISLGGYDFGVATRITARTRIGKGEIIDIERKVELSGPIHSKGVMILSSYLGSTYAKDMPLSLSVSLVFEQSYGMVEGDSASSTELYAILSSLSELPIKQNIAVTGSVNQFGEVQAIGGVNEKIEGFFDICMRHDPKASYGVIIPHANVKHLMLKEEVLEAVKNGTFTVYAVKNIDEGISILTGEDAKIVNAKVVDRLRELSKIAREFNKSKHEDEAKE
ncbi:ATP-binding protein [Sulfurimonas sp. HSL-1716]|uniref:Lon protease family protein n=1 Tax=Hydrocurvibacter sulfurireducens TaxID=3131937 RepID=UPI0031FA2845